MWNSSREAGLTAGWREVLAGAIALAAAACGSASTSIGKSTGELVPVQTFELENGLRVVFHIDRSDPVVAVTLAVHAGSARETPGRTGFAHMFEHLFFLDSENLGPGGLDRLSARIGGAGANGFTNNDQTVYLQTVPNDALEKMIWAEADKLGYFINTVTPAVLEKEKQVVKNEKRQSVDNRPYGHLTNIVAENLYPADHPYSWSVIGSLADLDAATLEDVTTFHARWYVPNNATLILAGDFDPVQAKAWVEKYFSDIPRGEAVERPAPRQSDLTETRLLMHEDNFATLPQLVSVWPSASAYHEDIWPLRLLQNLLLDGQEAPLNRVVVQQQKLAGSVDGFIDDPLMAGKFYLLVRAFDGVDLDRVQAALDEGFTLFESEGVDAARLDRMKAVREANFYGGFSSVLNKSSAIARYDGLLGDPAFADQDLARLKAVTADDVMRVYRTYIADKPHLAVSFVPRGRPDLAIEGSAVAHVVVEPIVQGAEEPIDPMSDRPAELPKTFSSFDRSVEPPAGPRPEIRPPPVWQVTLENGLAVSGIEDAELPLVTFEFAIDGGRLREDAARPGIANIVAEMLTRGTANKTRAEFENALKALGAQVGVSVGDERIVISGRTLSRNLAPTMALVEEMILEPRWDVEELALVKDAAMAEIQAELFQPTILAQRVMSRLMWGTDHVLAQGPMGTMQSVASFTRDDLAAFHGENVVPGVARVRIVGPVNAAAAQAALAGLGARWQGDAQAVDAGVRVTPHTTRVYFYDAPGAVQSQLLFSHPGLARGDADYYPAVAMNFVLGGGGFASRLTQELREGKGYTYGVGSAFSGGRTSGAFQVSSGVRANVTLEAVELIRDIVRDYGAMFTEADLTLTRDSMSKRRALAFETHAAKLGMLATIGDFGLPPDYVAQESAALEALTVERVKELAEKHIRTDAMNIVIVGDARTQAARLRALGYGDPVMVTLD